MMVATIFRHPGCGDYRVKFDSGLFFLPVVWKAAPPKCVGCRHLKPMPEGFCCIADGVGETQVTIEDIRMTAISKWAREEQGRVLAATATREKEGMA